MEQLQLGGSFTLSGRMKRKSNAIFYILPPTNIETCKFMCVFRLCHFQVNKVWNVHSTTKCIPYYFIVILLSLV